MKNPLEHLLKDRCPTCWGRHYWCNQTRWKRIKAGVKEFWRIRALNLADRFSIWAIRIRGQKVYGTHCQVSGNEAAALTDRIWFNLVIAGMHKEQQKYANEVEADLQRLAQLAGATWFHENPDIDRPMVEVRA
jgi:hypothetical protein